MPPDWLASLETMNLDADLVQASLEKFIVMANERIQSLDAQYKSMADTALITLKNNVVSLLASIRDTPKIELDAIPNLDSYTLEDLLVLRAVWRDVNSKG